LDVISQLVHERIIDNRQIIELVKYLVNDILQARTKVDFAKRINPRTGNKRSYNSHQFAKGERFFLSNTEFIVDND
jgi:hypothetical protein